MTTRNALIQKGMFPETLPPCFDSEDLKRGFHGIIADLKALEFRKDRSTKYVRYVGTKHDGNRRFYATPNPVPYFNVASFIEKNSKNFELQFGKSQFSISTPRASLPTDDRAILVSSLNELSETLSKKIKYAPFVLKTDIAQFFPSIYTHVMPWVAHGQAAAKADQKPNSDKIRFNRLDWFSQQCQSGQTRGVVIGPDGFRIIAEYIACEIDIQLAERAAKQIVGGVRHVDDFYIGVRSEIDATIVLSHLRDILQNFELQINDSKTRILSGLEPVDDVWAQNLRAFSLSWGEVTDASRLLDEAFEISKRINSESPMKLALRRLDQTKFYRMDSAWSVLEPKLQRILHHFPHCIDYVCLLLAKRNALDGAIDRASWAEAATLLVRRHIGFSHHHELCWLMWVSFVCGLPVDKSLIAEVSKVRNSHVSALLIAAYSDGLLDARPGIGFANKISTTDEDWLHNLVARSNGFTKAAFGGTLNNEFEHFAAKNVRLLDFQKHTDAMANENAEAISRSKYGYDAEDDDDANVPWADGGSYDPEF